MSQFKQNKQPTKTKQEIRYENELVKRRYFDYLEQSKGFSKGSIDTYERAILRWQDFSEETDFGLYSRKRGVDFKKWLADRDTRDGKKLTKSYQYDTLRKLRGFFEWLSKQEGFRNRIQETDIDFLTLSKKETQEARQQQRSKSPTMKQVKAVIESIEPRNEVDLRDRALISFTLLTGARISAIASLPMQAFDRNDEVVDQNPKLNVKTKYSKQITTVLFSLEYKEPRQYFLEWYDYLANERGFGSQDPIFPATKVDNGKENISFYSTGKVDRTFWKNSGSARKIFEKRFLSAGVPYFHPHTLRHLVVKEIMKIPLTEEQKKAISQNLGHSQVATTFGSYGYGQISEDRQVELLKAIESGEIGDESKINLSEADLHRLAEVLKENK